MIQNKLFPWHLAQIRKKIMDPIAKFWEDYRDVWSKVFKP